MKRLLNTILRERTETIEFREIKKHLLNQAQNRKNTFDRLTISDKTITMLQNEGLTVERVNEHGYQKFRISW